MPRDSAPVGLDGEAASLFVQVQRRASTALALLVSLMHSQLHERVAQYPLHGNLERSDKTFFLHQISTQELRKFPRRQMRELECDEFLTDALTSLEQLTAAPYTPVVRLAALEAIIVLSDLYSHPRYIWLYGILQRLHVQSEFTDDANTQPYTLLGMCKAVAVLQWDKEESRFQFLADALRTALTRSDVSLRTSSSKA